MERGRKKQKVINDFMHEMSTGKGKNSANSIASIGDFDIQLEKNETKQREKEKIIKDFVDSIKEEMADSNFNFNFMNIPLHTQTHIQ